MEFLEISEPVWELLARFTINIVAISALVFGLYYRRYRDKEMATTASMFNIFAFSVLTILSSVDFSIAAGFGLFAILALFSLRSEQIGKIEIAYFFGSIAIAVICSVLGTGIALVILVNIFVLIGAYLIDHPRFMQSINKVRLTLDKIDAHALSDVEKMRSELSARLGVDVLSFEISELNYVNDLARLKIYYRG